MLRIYLFSIFTIKMPQALNREDADKCTLTITNLRNLQITILYMKKSKQ